MNEEYKLKFGLERNINIHCFLKEYSNGYIEYTTIQDRMFSLFEHVPEEEHMSIDQRFLEKKIILVGHGASGKDYFMDKMCDYGLKRGVGYTTRNKRSGEIDGVSYNFVDKEKFEKMIVSGELLQWNKFGETLFYGTTIKDFANNDIFIMSPNVIDGFTKKIRNKSFVIFFDIDEKIRIKRMKKRGFSDQQIQNRLKLDNDLFHDFDDYDMVITNPKFNPF